MSATAEDIVIHIPELRRYARQLTRDNVHGDDLLQETLTRALRKLHMYDPSGSFKGWLSTIMKNLFLDERRRRQKWPTSSYVEQDHGGSRSIKPPQIDRIVLAELNGAIARLPAAQREVLMGVIADGWSYEEAASRLGVAIGTVRSRLFRARSALMAMLDPTMPVRGGLPEGVEKPGRAAAAPELDGVAVLAA